MGILDVATRTIREGAGQAVRAGNWAAGQSAGRLRRITGGGETPGEGTSRRHSVRPKSLSDADLANKVASVIFRGREVANVDKGKIDINAVDGAVWLRGEAPTPAAIRRLEAATEAIPEVTEVHNLLRLPKTPSPTRATTPKSQRRTASRKPKTPRTQPRRANADKSAAKVDQAEPAPEKVAKQRKGRQPAPLGSKGGDSGGEGGGTRGTTATSGRTGARVAPTRKSGEDSAPAKRPTSSVGTERGTDGGGGEVVT